MLFLVVGLMWAEWAYAATAAFGMFIVAALSDWFDGYLARKSNQVSTFGRFMDAVIDKVMVIGLMIALVDGDYFGELNMFAMLALLAILTREFGMSGLRMIAASKGIVLEADTSGKIKTFTQLNAIGWLLGARMFREDFEGLFGASDHTMVMGVHWIGVGLYFLSAVLTVTSGISYLKRHAHVMAD